MRTIYLRDNAAMRSCGAILFGDCRCAENTLFACCGGVHAKLHATRFYGETTWRTGTDITNAYINRFEWTDNGQSFFREWREDMTNGRLPDNPSDPYKRWTSSCSKYNISKTDYVGWYLASLAEVYQAGEGYCKYISPYYPTSDRSCHVSVTLDEAWENTKFSLCTAMDSSLNCTTWTELQPGDTYNFPSVTIGPNTDTYHAWHIKYKVERRAC